MEGSEPPGLVTRLFEEGKKENLKGAFDIEQSIIHHYYPIFTLITRLFEEGKKEHLKDAISKTQ